MMSSNDTDGSRTDFISLESLLAEMQLNWDAKKSTTSADNDGMDSVSQAYTTSTDVMSISTQENSPIVSRSTSKQLPFSNQEANEYANNSQSVARSPLKMSFPPRCRPLSKEEHLFQQLREDGKLIGDDDDGHHHYNDDDGALFEGDTSIILDSRYLDLETEFSPIGKIDEEGEGREDEEAGPSYVHDSAAIASEECEDERGRQRSLERKKTLILSSSSSIAIARSIPSSLTVNIGKLGLVYRGGKLLCFLFLLFIPSLNSSIFYQNS
jgi:hypothetical protein